MRNVSCPFGDEIRHADYCYRMAELCGARDAVSVFDTSGFIRISELPLTMEDLDLVLTEVSAVGETLAAGPAIAAAAAARSLRRGCPAVVVTAVEEGSAGCLVLLNRDGEEGA